MSRKSGTALAVLATAVGVAVVGVITKGAVLAKRRFNAAGETVKAAEEAVKAAEEVAAKAKARS